MSDCFGCKKLPELTFMGGRHLSWTCGTCGRIYQPVYSGSLSWWEETRGPTDASLRSAPRGDFVVTVPIGTEDFRGRPS